MVRRSGVKAVRWSGAQVLTRSYDQVSILVGQVIKWSVGPLTRPSVSRSQVLIWSVGQIVCLSGGQLVS